MNTYLNIFSAILVLTQCLTIYRKEVALQNNSRELQAIEKQDDSEFEADIYYIILDAYARGDILKRYYDYDNQEFLGALELLGFYVAGQANSNYAHTPLSLASSMNMTLLDEVASEQPEGSSDFSPLDEMIGNSQVVDFLKSNGYTVVNFSSGVGATEIMESADENLSDVSGFTFLGAPLAMNEFYLVFLQTTVLSPLVQDQLADGARGKILYVFDALTEMPFSREKKFVIAHLILPHPPYLFDREGNPVSNQFLDLAGDEFKDRDSYLDQLMYTNSRALDTITKIIQRSETPPVIVLQSDHGPASILGHPGTWTRPPDEEGVRERMGILYGVYTPGIDDAWYETITPVNTFPILFNNYFQTNIPLKEDRSTYTDNNGAYEFLDVTEVVSKN